MPRSPSLIYYPELIYYPQYIYHRQFIYYRQFIYTILNLSIAPGYYL